MTENNNAWQNEFLKTMLNNNSGVFVFLTSGIKLCGKITGFDNRTVMLTSHSETQMLFKSAISTIQPEAAAPL